VTAQPKLYRLDTDSSTLIVSTDYAVPRIVWFGQAMGAVDEQALLSISDLPLPHAKLDAPAPLSIFPDSGSGYLGPTALEGHRSRAHFASVFTLEAVQQSENTLVFSLLDSVAELRATLHFVMDDASAVMSIHTTVENLGDTLFSLNRLSSATLPLADADTECMSLHGRWGFEFQQHRSAISATQLRMQNSSGRTSHEHFPGCVVGRSGFDSESGEVLGVHLAYSGNYEITLERLSTGEGFLQAGMACLPGEMVLAPGEAIETPRLCACRASSLNTMSQRFHQFARTHILPKWTRKTRPIHANSWEALYFDHDESHLLGLVDAAAKCGAERFVLDDGWFQGRRDDTSGLGDWWVDKSIYPQGLHTLVAHIRQYSMQFGLWFEPEMVNPDSELYREHPEWALHVEGHTTPLARNQLVLNLGLPEVQDYLYNCIAKLVNEYAIDYIKWDLNRDLVLPGSRGIAGVHHQVLGAYALIDRLNESFPELEIESCSSGGARADFGILSRTGRVWASDCIDPIDRLSIQRGFSVFFPPESMGAHVGHDVAHLTGRATTLQTRAIVALQGQFGYEFDARVLSDDDQQELRIFADCYKRNRNWLNESASWVVPTRDEALFIQGQVSQDQSNAMWTIVTKQSLNTVAPERIRLLGLDNSKRYNVKVVGMDALKPFCKKYPSWIDSESAFLGSDLMTIGLSLPVMPAQTALLLECDESALA
jgi:alpha-galactosidase